MRVVVGLVLSAILVLSPLGVQAWAWSWHTWGGSEYSLTDNSTTWELAEAEAVAALGHLVTINDASEQTHLIGSYSSSNNYWIGFTDRVDEGVWKWISGQTWTYTNWNTQEPNNSGNEDYAVMNWGSGGTWGDLMNSPGRSISGIIERPVPLPGTALLLGSGLAGLAVWRRRRS